MGGGFGGATAARYLRVLSGRTIAVTLVEPEAAFVSCPLSNHVLGGSMRLDELTVTYDALARVHGVRVVRDTVARLAVDARVAVLAAGARLPYDRLVLAPGVELMDGAIDGLADAKRKGLALAAWKAGPETLALRAQLEAMPDGGVVAITVPEAPYKCPPGPYERACVVAGWLVRAKPRAKLLVLDANNDVVSKPALFKRVWADRYPRTIEYRPNHRAVAVDAAGRTVRFDLQDDVRADVVNVLPPMRAGRVAVDAGLANVNGRWCGVDYRTFESTAAPRVHVVGDAVQAASAMPKSGHMANAHAKVAAAAIVALLRDEAPDPAPMLTNTCYSFVDATDAMHIASVHAYDAAKRTYEPVPGAGGLSTAPSALEGVYGLHWARTIRADALG